MDGTPLDQAYTAAKNADAAAMAGETAKAAELFNEAAEKFENVAKLNPTNPAIPVIKALAEQHRSRATYLSSGQAKQDARKYYATGSGFASGSGVQAQLAAARGQHVNSNNTSNNASIIANLAASTTGNNTHGSPSSSIIAEPTGDALNTLVSKSTSVFKRTFEQQLGGRMGSNGGFQEPSESFYLVRPKGQNPQANPGSPLQNAPPSASTNVTIGQVKTALDVAVKAQRQYLKSGLQQLRQEVVLKEQKLQDEHTEEVDRLRAENDKLRVQVSKLKSRWDDLKQSARKRREET